MPAPTTARFAISQCEALFREVNCQITATIPRAGRSDVHDLRVLIRKFRHVLRVLKGCFARSEAQQLRKSLKIIMTQAGNVRDLDMAVRLLQKKVLPESDTAAPEGIVPELRERRKIEATALQASLKAWTVPPRSVSALHLSALHRDAEGASWCTKPAKNTAKRILRDLAKDHFRRGKVALDPSASDDDLHRFRIATKNFRYTADFFSPLYQDSLQKLRDQLSDLQGLLGNIHDSTIVRRMIRAMTDSGVRKDGKQVYKAILSILKERQRRKTKEFRREYEDHFAHGTSARYREKKLRLL